MKIYIIRHGETNANKERILQGKLDMALNDFGIKLAEITGEQMKSIKFDACYSSPLKRAKQTAEIILKNSNNNIEIQYDDRLKEIDMGIYEGKKIMPPDMEVPIFVALAFKYNPYLLGRFKQGESVKDVSKRTQEVLKEISLKDYDNVLVSTHGCAVRAMLNMFYKRKYNFWQGHVPYNCSVNIVEVNNGKMSLIEKDKTYYDEKYKIDRFK